MSDDRVLSLEGVHNIRDYGGYAVVGGGRLKRGLLWRSGEHGRASDADLVAVAKLGLTTVIDLRGNSERTANPCRRPEHFSAEVVFHDGETAGLALHVEAADGVMSEADARAAMARLYREIPFRERLIPVLRRYFEVLATRDGPSLVHCLAGKDRTGLAVALFHRVLGVSQADVMADYLLTNSAGNIERRIAAGGAAIRERHRGIDDGTIRVLMGVEPDYLTAALAVIQTYPGGFERYMADVLGVDEAMLSRLRERYIEP